LSGWSIHNPPAWLVALRWAPGFRPAIPGPSTDPDVLIKHFWHLGRHRRNERRTAGERRMSWLDRVEPWVHRPWSAHRAIEAKSEQHPPSAVSGESSSAA
jgi:hypothetical protein